MVGEAALRAPRTRRCLHSGDRAVVYLPGLGPQGSDGFWGMMLQRLEVSRLRRDADVFVVERRAGQPAGTTIADLAAQCAADLRSIFAEPVDVVGMSTGGSIALQLAADHPGVVNRLVVVSAAKTLSARGRATQASIWDLLEAGRPRRAAATMLAATTSRKVLRPLLWLAGFSLGRIVVGAADDDLIATIAAEEVSEARLDPAAVPGGALVVIGALDPYSTRALSESTAEDLGGRLLELRGRGHVSLATSRAAGRSVRAWLATRNAA